MIRRVPALQATAALASIRSLSLPFYAAPVMGIAAGTIIAILVPGALGSALGILMAAGGLLASAALSERRAAARHEQVFAAIGEVKVRLAPHSIRIDGLGQRLEQLPMGEADAAPARATLHELTAEVGLLGDLMHQIATTLSEHETALAERQDQAPKAEVPVPPPTALVSIRTESPPPPAPDPVDPRFDEQAALVSKALSEGRVEIHLQPIVNLPQRRTMGYAAMVRLRLDEETLLLPDQFQPVVEARGFGPTLDALALTRALAIARHLGSKGGDAFVSCMFSGGTWRSPKALATLSRILEKYAEHAHRLVLDLPQSLFRTLEPSSLGLIGAMAANGVRFSLSELGDLRLDPVALSDRGVRFVKASADLLLAETGHDIAPADLSALLERASVALVASDVPDDPTAAAMIELGVPLGQGLAFSPPRPVKPEVFAEPQEQAPAAPAAPVPRAEIVPHPAAMAPRADSEAPPAQLERLPFRAVLRRASA